MSFCNGFFDICRGGAAVELGELGVGFNLLQGQIFMLICIMISPSWSTGIFFLVGQVEFLVMCVFFFAVVCK